MLRTCLQNLLYRLSRPTSHELAVFAKELAFLITAGVPLFRALSIIESQIASKKIKLSISNIKESVSSGATLSASLKKEKIYPEMFENIVAAGEAGGVLEASLSKIASYYEAKDDLRKKMIGATIYPALVLSLSLASIIFIAAYLVPTMNGVFSGLGVETPLLTRAIGGGGAFLIGHWHIAILTTCAAPFFLVRFFKNKLLNVPVMGDIFRKLICSRISGTLSTLLSSGVPLIPSLSVASAVAGNVVYRRALGRAIEGVEQGEKLSESLKKTGAFPGSFCELVSIGEETGRLDAIFSELEAYYERDASSRLKVLTSLVEPASTILVGAAVGAIVFSIFIPLMSVVDALAK